MRRLLCLAVLVLAACGDPNAGKQFVDARWGVRDALSTHSYDAQDYNGANGVRVTCTVAESMSTRNLSFTISTTSGGMTGSFGLMNAAFTGDTQVPAAGCTARVIDSSNTYSGPCGGSTPSMAQPCQVQSVMFYIDPENMLPTVDGTMFCRGIPNEAAPMITRDVTMAGDGSGPASMPALFRITNCHGLTL